MTTGHSVNQLVIATVARFQARTLTDRLTAEGFSVTQVDSSGGLLDEATVSLLIGLDGRRLGQALEAIRKCCRVQRRYVPTFVADALLDDEPVMIETERGGATVIVLDVERFEQL